MKSSTSKLSNPTGGRAMTQLTNPTNKQELREILDGSLDAVRQTCSECTHPRCHGIINSLEVTLNVWHRQAIEQAITAYTNAEIAKALIKELENVDKLTRPTLPDSGSVEMNVRAWCMDRIAILAKIKEV